MFIPAAPACLREGASSGGGGSLPPAPQGRKKTPTTNQTHERDAVREGRGGRRTPRPWVGTAGRRGAARRGGSPSLSPPEGGSPGDAPPGGGCSNSPHPPKKTLVQPVGAALPRARGGNAPKGYASEGHRDLPWVLPAHFSAGQLVRRRRRNKGEGAGRGAEGRRPLRGCRAPRINRIKALGGGSPSRPAAGEGPWHGSLPPCPTGQCRSHPNRAPVGVPAPSGRRAGGPPATPAARVWVCPPGKSRRGVN